VLRGFINKFDTFKFMLYHNKYTKEYLKTIDINIPYKNKPPKLKSLGYKKKENEDDFEKFFPEFKNNEINKIYLKKEEHNSDFLFTLLNENNENGIGIYFREVKFSNYSYNKQQLQEANSFCNKYKSSTLSII
jgi:hypothetical protein